MRSSIKLAVSWLRYYRKQAVILFLGICMSVLLLNGIASLMYSNRNADYENAKQEYGNWQYKIKPAASESQTSAFESGRAVLEHQTESGAHQAESRAHQAESGEQSFADWQESTDYNLKQAGVYCAVSCETENEEFTLCYGDEDCLDMTGRELLEGKYPEKPGEIALDYYALHNLKVEDSLGSVWEWNGEKYTLTGILSEGAKTDQNDVSVFTGQDAVIKNGGELFYYLRFSEEKRVYDQLEAFIRQNQIKLADWEVNEAIASYIGAEPKESVTDILLKASRLESGKLIYVLGTLENNSGLLQKTVYVILFVFGVFIIYSIFQVNVEKRRSQYGILEVLGMEGVYLFAAMFLELFLLFLPAYAAGSILGNLIADLLYPGEFIADRTALYLSIVLFLLCLFFCCLSAFCRLRKMTQAEKIKNYSGRKSRRIVSFRRHDLMNVLSRRFLLTKKSAFAGMAVSLSLGGVLFLCTTYVAENAKQNNIHAMQTDQALYTDIRVSIEDDDLKKVIPKEIADHIKAQKPDEIKSVFPVSYTLGEIPLRNGIFKWTEFYPELDKTGSVKPDEEIMQKYNGIATKQKEGDYRLKVNVYGYENEQLSELTEYLLEGEIEPGQMVQKNQVIFKTLMDGGGYYNGIDIRPGDRITLKVPKSTAYDKADILKFQSSDEDYIEKEFTVSAVVSRCIAETDEFIGSGTDVVSIILPQKMMESNFEITDYHSLNIDLEKPEESAQAVEWLEPFLVGLNKCIIRDNTVDIDRKNGILMQKVYFFYGIAVILFFVSLLHTVNSMKHQIQSRRYESGVLRAMGITKQGFRNMLMKEGLFYGISASVCMLVQTLIYQRILAGVMQHIIRYIIVNHNIELLPCIFMVLVNVVVCVLAMLLSGRELLQKAIVEELKV